jgi:hypothetical protein
MKKGVTVTVVMDCCHSGTVMDLPYVFDSGTNGMKIEKNFNFAGKDPSKQDGGGQKGENGHDKGDADTKSDGSGSQLYDENSPPLPIPVPRPPDRSLPPPPPPPTLCCIVM